MESDRIRQIIEGLCSLPHRGAGTANELRAAEFLRSQIETPDLNVHVEEFRTTRSYIFELGWFLLLLIAVFLFFPGQTYFFGVLGIFLVVTLLRFLDWHPGFPGHLPPQIRSRNIYAHKRLHDDHPGTLRLLIMAHYDSAPVSRLYLPGQVEHFHLSLRLNALVLLASGLYLTGMMVFAHHFPVQWWHLLFPLYFLIQIILLSVDYIRFGYTNGAADNASGCAAAIETARDLWKNPIEGVSTELLLTGAEEAGMKGAFAWIQRHKNELKKCDYLVLNFDNVGSGTCRFITETGALSRIEYTSILVRAAMEVADSHSEFSHIGPGSWHTGDFDTLPFYRQGVPCLTLSAQDEAGLIPHLHRPDDIPDNVDYHVPLQAKEFAVHLLRHLFISDSASE